MNWTKSNKRTAGAIGLLGTGAVAGAIIAAVVPASAATSTTTPSASSSTAASGSTNNPTFPAHGSAAHESQETAVTGANATKAQAAAVKAAGSGTAGAVTSDMTGTGYEVTVTKADGSTVEEHLDSSFAVMTHGGGAPDAASSGA